MRAARIHRLGGDVVVVDVAEPQPGPGQLLVALAATTINPVDVTTAAGRHYSGVPKVPFTAGQEAVGRVLHGAGALAEGTLVYTARTATGTLAERFLARPDETWELPADADAADAVALGIAGLAAWLPLAARAALRPGERVLVLGATGAVGRTAVQAARILGAVHVVGAGRDPAGLAGLEALGADAAVPLEPLDDLPARLAAACGGDGPDVVLDLLWGAPARAAVEIAAPGARIVQVGQSAAPQAELPSLPLRGKALSLLGYSNRWVPLETRRAAHLELVGHARAGRLQVEIERLPLDQAPAAWAGVRDGSGRAKPVLLADA